MDRLQAMETFLRVAEAGSFSAAARQLGVGQPAVSKTVAQLEARLGVALLVRSTRRLAPTEAGLRFAERARRAVEEADEAELAARGAGAGFAGRLRVSAATTFARLHVVPRLPAFLAAHPELTVEVILDDRQVDMVEEAIDVSLRMGDLPDSSATARRLATGNRSVIATPAYLHRAGIPTSPGGLAAHEAVVYLQGENRSWRFERRGTVASVTVSGQLRVSAAEGLRAAVLADIGVAIASDWMFAPELEDGRVVRLLPDWTLPPIDLWAVFPVGRMASARARAFANFVADALAAAG